MRDSTVSYNEYNFSISLHKFQIQSSKKSDKNVLKSSVLSGSFNIDNKQNLLSKMFNKLCVWKGEK